MTEAEATSLTSGASNFSATLLWAVVAITGLSVAAITVILVARPGESNTLYIASIAGFVTPVIGVFLMLAQRQNHNAMNSRLSELLRLTAKASKAEGNLEGKATEKRKK